MATGNATRAAIAAEYSAKTAPQQVAEDAVDLITQFFFRCLRVGDDRGDSHFNEVGLRLGVHSLPTSRVVDHASRPQRGLRKTPCVARGSH
jgi:hypothetical protein